MHLLKKIILVVLSITISTLCEAQQKSFSITGNEITLEGETIVISPRGDTLYGDTQLIYLNSGIYKSTVKLKNGFVIITLDSTRVSRMLGTKFYFDLKKITQNYGLSFNDEYPTIVNLWSATCKPCIEELPILDGLINKYPCFNHLTITSASDSIVKPFFAKNSSHFNVMTGRNDIIQYYKDTGFPVHLFIDQNMIIKKIIVRGISDNDKVLIDWFYGASF